MKKEDNLSVNFIFNIIYQAVNVLSPLIVTPKLARVFGVDYLGVKSYTFSIVYYFAIFGVLGLDSYGQRRIAVEKDDFDKRSRVFWSIYISRFSLVLLSIIIYIVYISLFSNSQFEKIIFLCWGIYLVREMINPVWFLQGLDKYRFLSIWGIVSQVMYVVCTYLFINEKEQLPQYVIIFTVIPLVVSLCYFPTVFKYVRIVKISIHEMFDAIKESIVYFIPTIATAIYSMVDKTMLGWFDKEKISTGLYEATEKLVKVALAVTTSSFTIMRTKMSYLFGKKDNKMYREYSKSFIHFTMFLCWPIMFGIMGISKDFVPVFFGNGYDEVVFLSYIFSLVVPCLTISGLMQAIYIFPYGLQKMMDKYYVIIVAVNIVMNIILIGLFGTMGAIISSIFAEFLLATILVYKARKEIEVKYLLICSIKFIISSIVMWGVICMISCFMQIEIRYKLVLEFVCALFVYFMFCFLLNDSLVRMYIKKILNYVLKLIKNR